MCRESGAGLFAEAGRRGTDSPHQRGSVFGLGMGTAVTLQEETGTGDPGDVRKDKMVTGRKEGQEKYTHRGGETGSGMGGRCVRCTETRPWLQGHFCF